MHKRLVIRAVAKLPPMSDEEVGRHIKAIGRWVKRQAMFDAMLAEAKQG